MARRSKVAAHPPAKVPIVRRLTNNLPHTCPGPVTDGTATATPTATVVEPATHAGTVRIADRPPRPQRPPSATRNTGPLPDSTDGLRMHQSRSVAAEGKSWSIRSTIEHWEALGEASSTNPPASKIGMIDQSDALTFAVFLDSLKDTAEYEAPDLRPAMINRVTTLLREIEQSPALQELCSAIASHSVQACSDLAVTGLNDMETARLVLAAESGTNSTAQVWAIGRSVFRLHVLDAIVLDKIKQRPTATDQVILRLGHQTMLAERLHLPGVARAMRYSRLANLSEEDLRSAEADIRLREQTGESTAFLADWAPWRRALQRDNPAPFAQLQASIDAKREAIVIKPAAMSEQAWIMAFKDLRSEEAYRLHELCARLTRQWSANQQFDGIAATAAQSDSVVT